ncbi:hypothetical protein NC652_015808 [Populus alba x Populus x berolinensis]|nr:hypothetical protein NC652_015808 [Populus alba x Populus x berolinensis]
MDFTHEVLNIVFPLTIVIPLLNILPPYLVFMLLSCIKRCIFSEDVAAKVVLITGACISSGIGEVSTVKIPICIRVSGTSV